MALATEREHVVLVDGAGMPVGTVSKAVAHHRSTPLHAAFSCYAVRSDGAVLLTRRARSKRTWPGVWTNACCGHPQLDEPLGRAVARRLMDELGVSGRRMEVVCADFVYRAEMEDGTVEHELCPVLAAVVDEEPRPDPSEVEDWSWVAWDELVGRAKDRPGSLSPWSVEQVLALDAAGFAPSSWLAVTPRPARRRLLDRTLPYTSPSCGPADAVVDPAPGERCASLLRSFLARSRRDVVALDDGAGALADAVAVASGHEDVALGAALVNWGQAVAGGDQGPQSDAVAASAGLLRVADLLRDETPVAADLAQSWALDLLAGAGLRSEALARAGALVSRFGSGGSVGRFLGLDGQAGWPGGERQAMRVVLLGAARSAVTRPLLLGAACVGAAAEPSVLAALESYADAVGLARCLRREVCGLFEPVADGGADPVGDLLAGRRTLLVERALRLAGPAGRDLLLGALGAPHLDEDLLEAVREVVVGTGAVASVERLIDSLVADALEALEPVVAPLRVCAGLRALAAGTPEDPR